MESYGAKFKLVMGKESKKNTFNRCLAAGLAVL
jgi:hypothetical protein